MFNILNSPRLFKSASACAPTLVTPVASCIPFRTQRFSHLLLVSTAVSAVNAANLIPLFTSTNYTYIGAGVTVATIATTLNTLLTLAPTPHLVKSPSIGVEFGAVQRSELAGVSDCNTISIPTSQTLTIKSSAAANSATAIMTGGVLEPLELNFWQKVACAGKWNILFVDCSGIVYYPIKQCGQRDGLTGLSAFADFSVNYDYSRDNTTFALTHTVTLQTSTPFILVPTFNLTGTAAASLATA